MSIYRSHCNQLKFPPYGSVAESARYQGDRRPRGLSHEGGPAQHCFGANFSETRTRFSETGHGMQEKVQLYIMCIIGEEGSAVLQPCGSVSRLTEDVESHSFCRRTCRKTVHAART